MSKFIFISFPNEAKAYEATRSLENLHGEGSLTLYGWAVLAKGQDGKLTIKQESDRGAMGITIASLVGGLIGLFGGPVGVAVGLGTGALLGSLNDLANLGVSSEFLDTVATDLVPGKVAVIAEVSEEWVTPLNEQMSQLGGVVHRTSRSTVEDELGQKDLAAAKAELSQLKSEYDHAKSEGRAKLQIRIAEVEAKAHTTAERLRASVQRLKQETEAKLTSLQAQAAKATGEAKARVDKRITELRADGDRRSHQLNQAWGFTKKAFATSVAVALTITSLTLTTTPALAFQAPVAAKVESAKQANTDARTAATEAEAATRKAAVAIDFAIKTSAKQDAHAAEKGIRMAIADAHTAARHAADKTEQAFDRAVAANKEFAQKAKQSAKDAADATGEGVEKAEAWLQAAAQTDKAAIEKTASEVRASLHKAELATKDAVTSGNAAAKAAWKKDMANSKK